MGTDEENPDIETVTDYAVDERFIRLHLDVHVSREVHRSFQEMMDNGDRSGALSLLKHHAPRASPFLELFFNPPLTRISVAAE